MIELRPVPGKLMLAGEYAVLRPDGACLAAAVGEVARARLTLPADRPRLRLTAFGRTIDHDVADLTARPADAQGLARFAAGALAWLWARHGVGLQQDLELTARGAIAGRKVGLGTSAAVTVATLEATLAAAGRTWPAADLAAAARAVHADVQGERGSGYDVTTIACGGVVAYHRAPQGPAGPRDVASALPWPADLHGAALFSGEPAATGAALERPAPSATELDAIQAACTGLLAAWPTEPAARLLERLRACQAAFDAAAARLEHLTSPAIAAVRAVAEAAGCVARTSGAGGGDCVLALAAAPEPVAAAVAAWQARGGHVVALLPADLAPRRPG